MEEFKYTIQQKTAYDQLVLFLEHKTRHDFLLMGPGGSGKTTIIANAIASFPNKRFYFAAFTNKAVTVFDNAFSKWQKEPRRDIPKTTIHKMLGLDLTYGLDYDDLKFSFDKRKVKYLADYDVIICDECSTISKDLFSFLMQTRDYLEKPIKFVFLGDYWQLPPVGETSSVVFTTGMQEKWPISKLTKLMRAANDKIANINMELIGWQTVFRSSAQIDKEKVNTFLMKYPSNLVSELISLKQLYTGYFDKLINKTDVVILTYSRKNCEKTNGEVQALVDKHNGNNRTEAFHFFPGDKCCIDKPIEESNIVWKVHDASGEKYITAGDRTGNTIYNGEIFDVVEVQNTKVKTCINNEHIPYFNGQVVYAKKISESKSDVYILINLDPKQVEAARKSLRLAYSRDIYIEMMTSFYNVYPRVAPGYCLTIYKAQGSEWKCVFVNLASVYHSLKNTKEPVMNIYRSTYTAISRASSELFMYF